MGRTIHPPSEYRFRMILRFRTPWTALLCATPDPPRTRIPNTTSAQTISSTNHSENLNRSRRGEKRAGGAVRRTQAAGSSVSSVASGRQARRTGV